jgi:hypothetical protein
MAMRLTRLPQQGRQDDFLEPLQRSRTALHLRLKNCALEREELPAWFQKTGNKEAAALVQKFEPYVRPLGPG